MPEELAAVTTPSALNAGDAAQQLRVARCSSVANRRVAFLPSGTSRARICSRKRSSAIAFSAFCWPQSAKSSIASRGNTEALRDVFRRDAVVIRSFWPGKDGDQSIFQLAVAWCDSHRALCAGSRATGSYSFRQATTTSAWPLCSCIIMPSARAWSEPHWRLTEYAVPPDPPAAGRCGR